MLKPNEWHKANRSNGTGGSNCVEAMYEPKSDTILVRHSKHTTFRIPYTREEWEAFCHGVRNGEFDLPA